MDPDESSNGSNDSSVNLDIGSPEPPENRQVREFIKSPDPETADTGTMDGPDSPDETPMSPEETPMSPDETPMSPDEDPMSPDETPMSPDGSQSADDGSRSSMGGSKSMDRPQSPEDNPRSPSPDNPRSPSPDNNISSSLDNPRSPSPDNLRSLSPDNLQSPSPGANIRSPSPGTNVRSPSPNTNVRSPSPNTNVRSPSPSNDVRSPSPGNDVRSPSPGVNVRSPSPSDNPRSPSPSDNPRSPSPDNPRSPSPDNARSPSPNLRSRSSACDNSDDQASRSTLKRTSSPKSSDQTDTAAYKPFIKLEPANSMKDKPMDSKTVETLEGELDFEEEVQEKEEEPVAEDKDVSLQEISDERVVGKVDKKKDEESKSSKSKERKLIKMDDPKPKSEKIDQEEGEADDGEVTDEDDLEEGEVKDGASARKGFPRPNCRFFNKGQCTWGSSCRFIHPGVNDKGNYNMFAPSKPAIPTNMMMMPGPPPPMPPPMPMMKMPPLPPHPRMRPMMGPEYRPFPPHEEPPPVESAWERGLRHAKEIMKKATRRKEQESDFEDKRMNLSIENPERLYPERDLEKYGPSYRRPGESGYFKDELDDPYDTLEERDIQERWRGGHYENFEVRWNRPDFDREFHDKERQRRYPRSMEREKFERRSPEADRWQDERYREAQAPRGRADEWSDPWRRSKTPKGRRSRSQPRSGRRSYSSGSSRSYSSSSSRSSFDSRSSYSKSSRFSSERSRSRSHPRVPSREARPGYRYNKSPTGGVRTFERDLYESRRRVPPQAAGSRDPIMRSPTLARNSSPPTRPPIGRGPSPVHKIVDISPLNKFSPSRRSPPPRKMAPSPVTKKQPKIIPIDLSPPMPKRGQYPQEGKQQKPRKSPVIDRKKSKVGPKSPSPLSPPMTGRLGDANAPKAKENRKHPAPHNPKGVPKPKGDYRNPNRARKSRSGSHSGSDSSRSASRSLSRSSHSSSRSRSRSRSLSRSVSMSSVSSVSSSISHSSSGSDMAKQKASKGKSSSKTAVPPGLRRPPTEKVSGKKEATISRLPQEGKVKERVTKEAKRTHERHFTEFSDHPKGSTNYEESRGTPTSLTIPLMVSKQSKDLIKQSGQKLPIKLNLLSKAQKQTAIDKSPVKADNRKHGERGDESNRGVKNAPVVSSAGSRKRPASPTHKKASASSIAAAKATNSRREELLKQLKAVEDAIARKKSKPN